jgi:hypothetical protein
MKWLLQPRQAKLMRLHRMITQMIRLEWSPIPLELQPRLDPALFVCAAVMRQRW